MMPSLRLFTTLPGLLLAAQLFAQTTNPNNTLRGRVLYQSSGNKPAKGVRIKETDSNGDYSKDNGDYRLVFQTKRNGAALALEVGPDTREGKKIELVNEKELKSAKLPAGDEELLDIIVCPAGQRDIAAQKYYRILRTTADRELEKKKKEVEDLLAQKEKDYQRISDLSLKLDKMQEGLDSSKMREQALYIASINLDRASQMVKDAVRKIEEENDVEGALRVLNAGDLDTAYHHVSLVKKQGKEIIKKANAEIQQVIEGYEFKIGLLEPLYRYGEVAECFEKMAEIYEIENYDKEKLSGYLADAAAYWGLNGKYQKQLEININALAIREKILPTNYLNLADSYNNLSSTYAHLGNYQKALEWSLQALETRRKVLPDDHPDLAILYNNLSAIYSYLGDYQKALEWNLQALEIREKVLSINPSFLANSYNNLAAIYDKLDDYQKALEYNLKALTIREKVLPNDHPDLAQSYNNLAATYFKLGIYQKALEYNLKALTIREKVLATDHPDLAQSNGNLALLYHNMAVDYGNLGDYEKQLEFNLNALTFYEKNRPADDPGWARSYDNLSLTYFNLGDYQKALEFNLKTLSIREKILPIDHPDLAQSFHNLALNYSYLGHYQKALEFNLKAVAIREKILPADHPDLCASYISIGRAYRDVGEYEKGIEYSKKGISIAEASNPQPFYLNQFYAEIGITYMKARQYPEAQTALEKSETLKVEEGCYRIWAMYYALQNEKALAVENLQKAISLGFKDLKWLETEPDLKNIRKEKGYKDLVEQLKKQ